MDIQRIKDLLEKNDEYLKIKLNPNFIGLLCNGSLASGEYIEGWSDIDLLVVIDKPEPSLLNSLSEIEKYLTRETQVKCGVSTVEYEILISAEKEKNLSQIYKYVESFDPSTKRYKNGVISWKNEFYKPNYKHDYFKKIDCRPYVQVIWDSLTKAYTPENILKNKKYLLRKIFKNIYFLMKLRLMLKKNNFNNEIEYVYKVYSENYDEVSFGEFKHILQIRNSWIDLQENDIQFDQIAKLWNEFIQLYEIIKRSC